MQSKRVDSERQHHTQTTRKPHELTASHAAQYYTAVIENATFKANHIHRSVICSSHSQILPLPHFTSLKMSIPITKLLREKKFSP